MAQQDNRAAIPTGTNSLTRLTERELEVLALIAEGKSNKEIAHALYITIHTVKAHVCRILYKLDKETRVEIAIVYAMRSADDAALTIDQGR